jgi:hypothetical protein
MIHEILVPYPNFRKSIACYSNSQLLNTLQSVSAVCICIDKEDRYDIHWTVLEQWRMWYNWKQAFIHFGLMCFEEAKMRKLNFDRQIAWNLLHEMKKKGRWYKPYWIGWEQLHDEHRALLMHYGECERFAARFIVWKNHGKIRNIETQTKIINRWLINKGFPKLFQLDRHTLEEAERFLNEQNAPHLERDKYPNPYINLGWKNWAIDRRSIDFPDPEEQMCEIWETSPHLSCPPDGRSLCENICDLTTNELIVRRYPIDIIKR